ncbi:MAG: hypothetical protein ACRC5M_04670 [Anaeroplasmataceae bacterium]
MTLKEKVSAYALNQVTTSITDVVTINNPPTVEENSGSVLDIGQTIDIYA